jgi:hypothetical protein
MAARENLQGREALVAILAPLGSKGLIKFFSRQPDPTFWKIRHLSGQPRALKSMGAIVPRQLPLNIPLFFMDELS